MEAIIAAALGVLFTVITFAVVFWIAWIFCWFMFGHHHATKAAIGVTALFTIVSFWSAWRRVDPNAALSPMTDADAAREQLAGAVTLAFGMPILTRRGAAGAAMLFIGGPVNLFEALDLWLHRLPNGSALLDRAANLYHRTAKGVPMAQIDDLEAAMLLKRLGLIKVGNNNAVELMVVRTIKELAASRSGN